MKPRALLAAGLTCAVLLFAGPAATGRADGPALPAATNACVGVWVVVDRGNGEATVRCATAYASGLEALRSAGFSVQERAGYVLQIHGHPAVPDPSSFVDYWSYWHANVTANGSFTGWSYSTEGAGQYRPKKGAAEGWRFGDGGTIAPAVLPPPGYAKAPTPTITGKAKKGKRLRVKTGTWSPRPSTIAVQWLRAGKAIRGATKTSYTVTKADKGKRLSVRVTVSASGRQTVTKTSHPTKKVPR